MAVRLRGFYDAMASAAHLIPGVNFIHPQSGRLASGAVRYNVVIQKHRTAVSN